jgi:hypothetical protein
VLQNNAANECCRILHSEPVHISLSLPWDEFLKEHRKNQQRRKGCEAAIAQQQKQIEALTAALKEQAAQIQKVIAQLEVSKAAPQTVLNNQ